MGSDVSSERVKGSRGVDLQQDPATDALIVTGPPGAIIPVDVVDRAARLLGIVYGDRAQLSQRAASFDLYTQLRSAGVEIDPRQIRALTAADIVDVSDRAGRLLGTVSPVAGSIWDVSDRAARLLGTVSPVAGSVWDISDRAARLLGKIYGDQGVLTQRGTSLDLFTQLRTAGTEYDARQIRALVNTDIVGVADGGGNRLPSMDAAARPGYVDVIDRPARQLGIVSGSITASSDVTDRWARQLGLIDLSRVLGAALSAANPVIAGIYDAAANRMPAMNAAATAGYVHLTDGSLVAELDAVDSSQVTIDTAHHKVHEGEHYTVTDSATINSGAGNKKIWRFTTPNTATRMHFVLSFSSNQPGVLTFNENPTLNAAGTGLTIFNSDRNSANATTLTAFKDTTLTGDGVSLTTVIIGTNAPATRIGGNTRTNAEFILKQNEDYVLMFTADLNATIIAMVVEFYEA